MYGYSADANVEPKEILTCRQYETFGLDFYRINQRSAKRDNRVTVPFPMEGLMNWVVASL